MIKRSIPIGELYDFAKDRLQEYTNTLTTSDKQKWENKGRVDLLNQLLFFVKHYNDK